MRLLEPTSRARSTWWISPEGEIHPLCRIMAFLQTHHTTCALLLLVLQRAPAFRQTCSMMACIDSP